MRSVSRRISVILVAVLFATPMVSVFTPQIVAALDGDPIQITSCDDLNLINSDLSADYQLASDIDCATTEDDYPNSDEWFDGIIGGDLIPDELAGVTNNGYSGFEPIGDNESPFTGSFDGNGKIISNLWIFRKNTQFVGLFAYAQNANIHNLTLNNSRVVGRDYTGGLVGYAENTSIQDVTIRDSMARTYLSFYGGGIAGEMSKNTERPEPAEIVNSSVINGAVHGSGNIVGGLVGRMNSGVIFGSSSSADVDGGYSIGGAVGEMNDGVIINTTVGDAVVHSDFSEGAIAKSGDKTGGFVGQMTGGSIYSSSSMATVEGEGSDVGGFVGEVIDYDAENKTIINTSHASGSVTGLGNDLDTGYGILNNSSTVGGFAGYASGEGLEISNSYATGFVLVTHDPSLNDSFGIGGFIGAGGCNDNILQSYATGSVSAAHANNVGGFVGDDGCEGPGGNYERVYATGNVIGGSYVGGLFGWAGGTSLTKSYATGNVTGNVSVGGLAGRFMSGEPGVRLSYATGNVQAIEEGAGGLFGYFSGNASDLYARGNVNGPISVGGFAGDADFSWSIRNVYTTVGLSANPGPAYGFIGDDNTSSDVIAEGLYFNQQTAGVTEDVYAVAKNTNQMQLIANQATFAGYDFDEVWEYIVGQNDNYPLFQWQNDPIGEVQCEQAHMTATTGRINCDIIYIDGDISRAEPAVWMNPQYRIAGETEWTSVDWTASTEGKHTFYNLDPETDYEFSMTVTNNVINQELFLEGRTLSIESDVDTDGVLDIDENVGPNAGDANNDNVLDAEQGNVTSFLNTVTNSYAVLRTDCSAHSDISIAGESTSTKDPAYDYTAGLMSFTSTGCGAVASVTQYFYGDYDASKFTARKYNPNTNAYSAIPGATIENVVIGGQKALRITYAVADNGPLDLSAITGTITDPAGPALGILGVPNTGFSKIK